MDHGGEAARPTTVGSTDLGMAAAVQGGEAHMNTTGTFHVQLGAAAAARRASFEPTAAAACAYHIHSSAEFTRHVRAASGGGAVPVAVAVFVFHREPAPGVVYANIGASWRQLGPVDVVLADPQLTGGAVPVHVHHNYGADSALQLQPRPGAGRGVELAALLPGGVGAVYSRDYVLQLRPGAGHGDVLVDLLPDGARHGEVFISPFPDADGVGAVFDNSGNLAQQTPGAGRAEGIVGALPSLGAGYGGSGAVAVADDLGAAYNNFGVVVEYLRRLLPFAGTEACSVAVNGLAAAGPSSPAVAFHLFTLLLGGLLLVILHVLRV